MRIFKKPLYRKLLSIWIFKWIYRYNQNKSMLKGMVYIQFILILAIFYISIPSILVMYIGGLLYRHRILRKLHFKIGQQFHKIFYSKFHKLIGIILIILYFFAIILLILMIFPIPFLCLMFLGSKYEKKLELPKRIKKQKLVYQYTMGANLLAANLK